MRLSECAANNIGISGIKYVLGPDVSVVRRLLWLICIVMATAWMLWNIQGRVVYFISRPSAINTEMKFKNKLMFPKITICNQNMFRSSRVFDESETPHKSPTLYEAVDRYLQFLQGDNKYQSLRQKVIDKYEKLLRVKHVKEFYRKVSHQKSTLIHRCVWKGQQCGPENFTEVFTNMGICYQFNVDREHMIVDKANRDGGLDVTLFIEQYDYMRGPQTTAGALVLVTAHNQTAALAKEKGIGLTVGQSISVGLEQQDVVDLTPPYGSCGTAELENYPSDEPYTYQKCHLNCLTSFIKRKCGCINIYMPGETSRYCSMLDNLQCFISNEELFYRRNQINACNCPSPCQSTNYVYSVSFVQFSDSFSQSLSLDDHSVSVATANRAVAIQAWGLLNKMNTSITDNLAELAIHTENLKPLWYRTSSLLHDFVDETKSLLTFAIKHNLTSDLKTDVKSIVNALSHISVYTEICDGDISEKKFRNTKDFQIAGLVLTGVRLWIDRVWFAIFGVHERYRKYEAKIFKFRQAVTDLIQSRNISYGNVYQTTTVEPVETLNASQLKENLKQQLNYLMSELSTYNDNTKEKERYILRHYRSQMNTLQEIGKKAYKKITPVFYSENLLKLEIYFKDLSVQSSRKSPAYSVEGLICDIGGSIGLCLGGSILTLVEIFDILAILFGDREKHASGSRSPEHNG